MIGAAVLTTPMRSSHRLSYVSSIGAFCRQSLSDGNDRRDRARIRYERFSSLASSFVGLGCSQPTETEPWPFRDAKRFPCYSAARSLRERAAFSRAKISAERRAAADSSAFSRAPTGRTANFATSIRSSPVPRRSPSPAIWSTFSFARTTAESPRASFPTSRRVLRTLDKTNSFGSDTRGIFSASKAFRF